MSRARVRSVTVSLLLVMAASVVPGEALTATSEPASLAYPAEVTPWRLTHYRWLDQTRAAGAEVRATTRLVDGALSGSGGCNRVAGTYSLDGASLATQTMVVTTRSCAEQTMVVERALLLGLERAATYRIEPAATDWQAVLVIEDAFGNEMLRYRVDDAGSLTAVQWRLERYSLGADVVEANADQPAVLDFESDGSPDVIGSIDGQSLGSSGCNGLVAEFFQHAAVLSLGPIETTDAPCGPELAAQQEAMLNVLDATSIAIELPPDSLILTSGDTGDRLEFGSSAPLEGGVWLLTGLDGRRMPGSEVIMRLAEGSASIFGRCGEFETTYTTNGVLIRFGTIPGVPDECRGKREERRLRTALRRARFVDLTKPTLRLISDDGSVVARFKDPGGP